MKPATETFEKVISSFCSARALQLEKECAAKSFHPEDEKRLESAFSALSARLAKEDLHYLREFRDLLIAKYNTDKDCFYKRGFNDCRHVYAAMFGVKTRL